MTPKHRALKYQATMNDKDYKNHLDMKASRVVKNKPLYSLGNGRKGTYEQLIKHK